MRGVEEEEKKRNLKSRVMTSILLTFFFFDFLQKQNVTIVDHHTAAESFMK